MPVLRHNYIDIEKRDIYPAEIEIESGVIKSITPLHESCEGYLLPGFIDAHIHIESSMLTPVQFAHKALEHGTIATVSDPHEIANVVGMQGVEYMLEDAAQSPFHFCFGAPSCVPATSFETAGGTLNVDDVSALLRRDDIYYLSEMMNYPGVLSKAPDVMNKIQAAHDCGKPIDGHAPGLLGKEAALYTSAGISTDHECFSLEEAQGKVKLGMKILIREGSAAKNYDALHPLIGEHPEMVMFCSDDKHPDDLIDGHINQLVARSVALGYDMFDVLQIACINPDKHYNLGLSRIQEGDSADFIVVNDLKSWKTSEVFIHGKQVVKNGTCMLPRRTSKTINQFNVSNIKKEDLAIPTVDKEQQIRVIQAIDGELITKEESHILQAAKGFLLPDLEHDVLKVVVVNRYKNTKPAVAFIQGFGLKEGAIASSVGHDSHNITAVGTNDEDLEKVINAVITEKGGLAVSSKERTEILPLPIAGLMSLDSAELVGEKYAELSSLAKQMGSTLKAPFMTLSFMSLLVIPDLKLSDKGLFSGSSFSFVDLFKD